MVTLESPFVEDVDLRTAAALLADMPTLLAASPVSEQRGILRGVFDRVWLAAHTISAIMPNRLYLPLASAAAEVCVKGGPGGDPALIRTHWLRRRRQYSGRRKTCITSSIAKLSVWHTPSMTVYS